MLQHIVAFLYKCKLTFVTSIDYYICIIIYSNYRNNKKVDKNQSEVRMTDLQKRRNKFGMVNGSKIMQSVCSDANETVPVIVYTYSLFHKGVMNSILLIITIIVDSYITYQDIPFHYIIKKWPYIHRKLNL